MPKGRFEKPESTAMLNLVTAKVLLARMLVNGKDDSDNDIRMVYTISVRVVKDLYDSETIVTNNTELLAGVVHKMFKSAKLSPKTAFGCLQGEMEAHSERLSKLNVIRGD